METDSDDMTDMSEGPERQDQQGAPDQSMFETLKEWIKADIEFSQQWRVRAKKDFEFMTNEGQWEPADRHYLMQERRPMVTFNLTAKFIKAICGLEQNNRHDTVYMPRELDNPGEVQANEVLTAGSQWMGDNCHADRHQSRAFRDTVICGMGWTEGALDFDEDPNGEYVETRCDPLEMVWDRNARDQNVMDSKRRARVRKMLLSEARALIPGVTDNERVFTDDDLDAYWAGGAFDYSTKEAKTQQEKERRDEARVDDDPRKEVHIVQIQWWEHEPYYLVTHPMTQQNVPVEDEELEVLQQQMGGVLPAVRLRRKKFKQAFIGNRILSIGDAPRPDGFTFHCMTGDPEDITGYFNGIVALLRDPAQWANKLLSQALHMLNSTAKGGIIVEDDAIKDVREFVEGYAKSEQVSVVRSGAIAKGKIMGKPGVANLNGVLQLYEIAKASFQDVSGLNLELMGLADRQQAGVLEAQRKQAGMTILTTLFDSLSLFRTEVGRTRLHFLQAVLADGRLIRVVGPDAQQAIPLIKDRVMGKYDVIVEDAPTSPNTKEKTWGTIQMLLPPLLKAGMVSPQMVLLLLDYVPFMPSKLVQALKKMAGQPNPQAQEQADRDAREQEAGIEDKEQAAAQKRADTLLKLAGAGSELAQAEATRTTTWLNRWWPPGPPGTQVDDAPSQPQPGQMPSLPSLPMLGEQQPPREAQPVAQPDAAPSLPPGMQLPGGLNGGGQ